MSAGPTERLLGAHVAHRAQNVARLRQALLFAATGQAEVGHPEFALIIEQQVRRLHIAMDNAVLVRRVQCLGRLLREPRDDANMIGRLGGLHRRNNRLYHIGGVAEE